ncbi:O-acyltransferase WSD1 [Camellia lanceoleosa]|uniref:O-acyltransferase WSD1 n=1 Tax=Camellia lanceoleosa TaxID=1840588 RepID=A0ACC0IJA2_9ERIC|nr:O-acyltransferase WSD1 [Camellia lanceoleosa]
MDSVKGLRWRKQVLKPIVTNTKPEIDNGGAGGGNTVEVVDEKQGGAMKLVQTKVNLDNHIMVPTLDPNMPSLENFIEDYISNLSTTTISTSKPMWDLHLLNLKTATAEAVNRWSSVGSGSSSDRWWWQWLTTVWVGLRVVCNTLVDVVMFMATALYLKDTRTPLKGPLGLEFTPRRFVYRTVSLDDMKVVKNAMNMTINDVALAITQAGLSRYLNRRYGLLCWTGFLLLSSGLVSFSFALLTASALSPRVITHTTMCFSNLVGPLEEITFYGHPLAYYVNKMTIVLSVDESTVPDPHQLCDDLEESLKLVKDAVQARGLINDDTVAQD